MRQEETQATISFRYANQYDIPLIVHIENQSFTVPWPESAFYNDIIHNRFAVYLLLEYEGRVVGYCGVWIVLDEAHITNIAVLPGYRGRKLGEALMRKVKEVAKQAGANTMTLEVRVSNTAARSLYQKLGFREGGIRKDYYTDNLEDAVVMWVTL